MDAHADATFAREIARAGSMTQRALAGWAATAGVAAGGGGVGVTVTAYTDHGDGTATISFGPDSGVTMVKDADGTAASIIFPEPAKDPAWDITSAEWKAFALAFVSTAENSGLDWTRHYGYIEDIGDGRGYTAGIVGWCSGTGDMLTLIRNAASWTPGNMLAKWVTPLQQVMAYPYDQRPAKSVELLGQAFINDWKTAAGQAWFQEAQRRERDRVYWSPALAQAQSDGVDALGLVVLYDISVNHGPGSDQNSFGGIVQAAQAAATPPSRGGIDAAYVDALIDAREQALIRSGDNQPDGRVPALRHLLNNNSKLYSPASWPMYGTTYTTATPRVPATSGAGGFGGGFGV